MMMADQREDYVAIHVDQKLSVLKSKASEACIFKVPRELRMVNNGAYEPKIISIGPYHRHNVSLKPMEDCKSRYLQTLLKRRNEDSAAKYIAAMRALEDRARRCYAEPVNLTKDEFVEMMVLDGCFVVEVIRKNVLKQLRDADDPIFLLRTDKPLLKHDMILLENQLPFFVLKELFQMTLSSDGRDDFFQLILKFFFDELPGGQKPHKDNALSTENIKHLLGFVHDNWLPSKEGLEDYRHKFKEVGEQVEKEDDDDDDDDDGEDKEEEEIMKTIPTATQMEEAGIEFKTLKNKRSATNTVYNYFSNGMTTAGRTFARPSRTPWQTERYNFFEIKFENGKMLIPPLKLHRQTEAILRNLIAYEQFSKDVESPDHVLDYTMFIDCLINSTKDVELLQKHGIIDNWLGDDKAVANLFNSLGHQVVHYKESYYSETFQKINKHCGKKWNRSMARLRHDYFNSPWAFISFFAASVLLLLTFLQTIYTILSHYKSEN